MTKQDVYKEKREVGTHSGVAIGAFSVIGGMAGAGAVVMGRSIVRYRPEVDGFWMACIPFIFPVLTGVGVAYKRKLSALATHLGMLFSGFFAGGVCFGYSVDPVFIFPANCTTVLDFGYLRGPDCDKPVLQALYIACGAIALFASVSGILLSIIICSRVRKRLKAEQELANSESVLEKMMASKQREQNPKTTYHVPVTSHAAEPVKSKDMNDGLSFSNKAYQNDTDPGYSTTPVYSANFDKGTPNSHATVKDGESVTKM